MLGCLDKTALALCAAAFLLTGVPMSSAQAEASTSAESASEFPIEMAALVAATAQLFEAVESSFERRPGSDPVISIPDAITPATVDAFDTKASVLTARGAVDHLTAYRIEWYPLDRFLGSADFMGTWDENRNLVCGFVTWDLTVPEAPELESVTATFLDVSNLAVGSDEQIHAALLEANCAFGAIDPNYAFFE